jgi:CRISPR-associated Csx2 family protein
MDEVRAGEYRQATYFLPDRPEDSLTTPFVAEAIVRLTEEEFDQVHILGTSDAMWEVLLEHFGDALDEEATRHLLSMAEERPEGLPLPLRTQISEVVGDGLGVSVEPHLIPVGTSTDEYWQLLRRLTRLGIDEGRVSIDITHSLRSHSVFLFLALVYLRSVHADLSLGAVYYGANVLASGHFEGRSPIFDLRPMAELLDWIDAAQAFDRYGDSGPLARLLRESDADMGDLAQRAEYVSRVLQLNTLSKVKANTQKLKSLLDELPAGSPLPLKLIRSRLTRLPDRLQGRPQWEATLVTAEEHWDSYRAGPAVLSAWEAVIERLAAAYGVDVEKYENHKALGALATGWNGWTRSSEEELTEFADKASTLRDYRNAIAHTRQGRAESVQPNQVYEHFPPLLEYFQTALQSEAFDRLPQAVSIERFRDDWRT